MREHTRKRHTEMAITSLDCEDDSPMTAEEAIHILTGGGNQAASTLRGLRYRDGFTQVELGKLLGIAQGNISLMEKGKRPIGKGIASA